MNQKRERERELRDGFKILHEAVGSRVIEYREREHLAVALGAAACPEYVLHARKTPGMLLLAHFAGDGVSVTRLVCWLVCKIS